MHTNYFVKSLMVGLTALSIGGVALSAQAQDSGNSQATAADRQAKFAEHKAKFEQQMAKRQARLHDKLKLTAAQEPAWTAFIASAKPRQQGERPAHVDFAKLSAPERMEKIIAMQKEHLSMEESRLGALKTFYATLTPEQQKVLDHSMGGKHGRWGHHGPRHGDERG